MVWMNWQQGPRIRLSLASPSCCGEEATDISIQKSTDISIQKSANEAYTGAHFADTQGIKHTRSVTTDQ